MKKIPILIVLFALLSLNYSQAKCVVVSKCDGGANGYAYVKSTHDPETDTHKLTCQESGDKQCKWDVDPGEMTGDGGGISQVEMEDWIEDQIATGIYDGDMSDVIINGTEVTNIQWEGSSTSCYTATFNF